MTIKGKLIKKLDVESGTSKAGKEWKRQSILVEQESNVDFNKEIVIGFFGDKIKKLKDLQEGLDVSVDVNIYSREYNGKYYHSIDGYWITQIKENEPPSAVSDDNMPF
jgi:hypothetical protein